MEEKELDYVLVPLGLAVFGSYHIWLLFSIIRHPRRTVVGLNAESRHQWVFSMMTRSLFQVQVHSLINVSTKTPTLWMRRSLLLRANN